MATVQWAVMSVADGAVQVTLAYDSVTLTVSGVSYVNTTGAAMPVTITQNATGTSRTVTIPVTSSGTRAVAAGVTLTMAPRPDGTTGPTTSGYTITARWP